MTPEDQPAQIVAASPDVNPRSMLDPYAQIALHLRGAIITRQLPPGTPLPSEPELVARYHVSRETVRRALQLLRDTGITETRRGIGHFVARTPEVRTVEISPGTQVSVRMPHGSEGSGLGLAVIEVSEPGKQPTVYDTATTVLVVPAPRPQT
jgi:GntR family transcriptional regulator